MRKVSFFTPRKTLKIKTNMVQVIICSIRPSTKYPGVAFIYHQEEEEDASPTYLALPHHGRSDSNHMRIPIRTSGVIIIRLCVLEIKGMWWRTIPCGYLSERKMRTSCARQIYRRCVSCSATRSSRGDSGPVSSSRQGRSCGRNTSLPSHIEMVKIKWNPCHSHGSAARF